MREGPDVVRELDALESKVYQAKELIGRLRQVNRELALKLAETERRRQSSDPVQTDTGKELGKEAQEGSLARELSVRLEHLQSERREIRRRLSALLQKVEALEI